MKIAIDINGVVRDVFTKASLLYEKFFLEEKEDFVSSTYDEKNEEWVEEDSVDNFEYKLDLPVKSLDLTKHFRFKSKEELYDFFYVDFPMQIFGHASSLTNNTFTILNEFYVNYRDDIDIYLISDEMGKSKPATLFFLSKYGSLIENINFYSNETMDKVIEDFDVVLTANPNIIEGYKTTKDIIKFNTTYNENYDLENSIDDLSELTEIIDKILKK